MQDSILRQRLKASHTPEQIRQRLRGGQPHSYLKDFIYGAVDGAVTTFAVVSGVAGAGLAPQIVIIMGMANLAADGFSMAVSNYLGVRSERQQLEKARSVEQLHIQLYPEGETEEIRQIFASKGFEGETLEKVVRTITANQDQWTNTMLQEEYDFPLYQATPWKAALATFFAFQVMGLLPVFPFLWNYLFTGGFAKPFMWSSLSTAVAFFATGAIKSRFVEKPWYMSGLETLLLGGAAALLAYLIGDALKGLM